MDFSKFDKKYNVNQIENDLNEMGDGEFQDVPAGEYQVALESVEMKETKTHKPMISFCFKVTHGEYKKRLIFPNFVVNPDKPQYGIKNSMNLAKGLKSGINVEFKGFGNYAHLLEEIERKCKGAEYLLEIKQNGDFRNYKILEVYEDDESIF